MLPKFVTKPSGTYMVAFVIKNNNVLYLPSASGYSKVHASGAEHKNITNKYFKVNITGLKIPTDRRQASWLFIRVAKQLNLGLP